MPIYVWIIIIVLSVLAFLDMYGLAVAISIIKPKRRSLLETSLLEEGKFPDIMDFYKTYLDSTYRIKSRYGYELAVYYLSNDVITNKYLIMAHGYTYTHHGCLKYARMMMQYGYNIIMYDQRFHGDSGGRFSSLGHYEKYDLYDIVTDTLKRYGDDIEIGLYGESMGAAIVILEAAMDNRIRYVFADCGFSSLESQVIQIIERKMPKTIRKITFPVKLAFRIITGISMNRISPKEALASIHVPVFFAHGKADRFIECEHSIQMFETYVGDKMIFIAENQAEHADSYLKDTEEYEKAISEFIIKYITKNESSTVF